MVSVLAQDKMDILAVALFLHTALSALSFASPLPTSTSSNISTTTTTQPTQPQLPAGTYITVHSNFSYNPNAELQTMECVSDTAACHQLYDVIVKAPEGATCGNRVICCRISRTSNTSPPFVPVVTRSDLSPNSLTDFHSCGCRPLTSPLPYLQERPDTDEWTYESLDVHVGFSCNPTPSCSKFLC